MRREAVVRWIEVNRVFADKPGVVRVGLDRAAFSRAAGGKMEESGATRDKTEESGAIGDKLEGPKGGASPAPTICCCTWVGCSWRHRCQIRIKRRVPCMAASMTNGIIAALYW